MTKSIFVFIVRHGEREDEAMDRRKYHHRKMSPRQRLDPSLTPRGFAQAQAAFDRLGVAMEAGSFQRVAIFSSPLRRAVGTATMLSSSSCATPTMKTSFVLPTTSGDQKSAATTNSIPILVYDGLCDCAAQVNRLGGNKNAIRTGFLHCAANQNSNDVNNVKLNKALKEMEQLADQGLQHPPQQTSGFKLWKVDDQSSLVPMSPSILFFGNNNNQSFEPTNSIDSSAASTAMTVSYQKREAPVDQAVSMAIDAGCDACIIVSHREEIRELYKYRCKYQLERKSLPYCCIGRFEVAKEEDDGSSSLQWTLHDVTPFDALTTESVRSMVANQKKSSGILLELKVPMTNPDVTCSVTLARDESMPFVDLTNLRLLKMEVEVTAPVGVEFRLVIERGRSEWFQFLYDYDNPRSGSLVGTAVLRLANGSLREREFRIHFEHQPMLPCPSKIILMHLSV